MFVNSQYEVDSLIQYLDFDFIEYEFGKEYIGSMGTEYIVRYTHRNKLVVNYRDEPLSFFMKGFDEMVRDALPLKAFIYPNDFPEHFI